MKINHGQLISEYLARGLTRPQAYRKAVNEIRSLVKNWAGSIVVFFGAPGSGKTSLISRMVEPKDALIIETVGLNVSLNSLLLRTQKVDYCEIASTLKKCIKSVCSNKVVTLQEANNRGITLGLVNKYFSVYNNEVGKKSHWAFKLPQERQLTQVEEY